MDEEYVCFVMLSLYKAVIQTYCVFGTLNGVIYIWSAFILTNSLVIKYAVGLKWIDIN